MHKIVEECISRGRPQGGRAPLLNCDGDVEFNVVGGDNVDNGGHSFCSFCSNFEISGATLVLGMTF